MFGELTKARPGKELGAYAVFRIDCYALADLGGVCPGMPPPKGPRFFRFDIQNFQNVTTSGVHAHPRGPRPLREILDPPLLWDKNGGYFVWINFTFWLI